VTTTQPTATDYLKYVAAEGKHLLDYVDDTLGCLTLERPLYEDEVEMFQSMIGAVRHMIVEAAAAFSRDGVDLNTYSDGRSVETTVELEKGNVFGYRRHPDPQHRDDRPRTVLDRWEASSGDKHSVFVELHQRLRVEHHGRGLHLVAE
jgi:hypothetical protein